MNSNYATLALVVSIPMYCMHNAITPADRVIDIVDKDEIATEKAYITYFRNDESAHIKELKPYIKQVIKETRELTPKMDQHTIIDKLENGGIDHHSDKDLQELNAIIIKSIDKAFDHYEQEQNKKWSRKQASFLAATTSILSTIVTALVFAYDNRSKL